jgi:hypothetical protein
LHLPAAHRLPDIVAAPFIVFRQTARVEADGLGRLTDDGFIHDDDVRTRGGARQPEVVGGRDEQPAVLGRRAEFFPFAAGSRT